MPYTLETGPNSTSVRTPDGRVVFEYVTRKPDGTPLAANSACFLHPVNTPSGERLTDLAPGDHRHHRGVFLAWHAMEFREPANFSGAGPTAPRRGWNIQRADFWGWGQFAPTTGCVIRNQEVRLLCGCENGAEIESRNGWSIENTIYLTETTRISIAECRHAYILDLEFRLAPRHELVLDRTAFGGFCVRARRDGEFSYAAKSGPVTHPDPHYSIPELNWPAADWYDYTIRLADGKVVGVAVIDHPTNPPATWHNPRYLSMLNPCLLGAGPLTLAAGVVREFRYRIVAHDGAAPSELLNRLSDEFRRA